MLEKYNLRRHLRFFRERRHVSKRIVCLDEIGRLALVDQSVWVTLLFCRRRDSRTISRAWGGEREPSLAGRRRPTIDFQSSMHPMALVRTCGMQTGYSPAFWSIENDSGVLGGLGRKIAGNTAENDVDKAARSKAERQTVTS